MKRGVALALALLLLQALLLGGWWLVERRRGLEPERARLEQVDRVAPPLSFEGRDGRPGHVAGERRVVVHFWATWCPPCREELPALLRWAAGSGEELLAVSVDPDWSDVDAFFGGSPPAPVVLAPARAAEAWGARELPATFVVEGGRITRQARGAVDWRRVRPLR